MVTVGASGAIIGLSGREGGEFGKQAGPTCGVGQRGRQRCLHPPYPHVSWQAHFGAFIGAMLVRLYANYRADRVGSRWLKTIMSSFPGERKPDLHEVFTVPLRLGRLGNFTNLRQYRAARAHLELLLVEA